MTDQTQEMTRLLAEIFIPPTNLAKQDRFSTAALEAGCSGKCASGMCRSTV